MEYPRVVLPRPTVILACGISSSGKTTVIEHLSRIIVDSFWIDKDTFNNAFLYDKHGNIIPDSIDSDYYHDYVKNQTYQCMLDLALINIGLGKHPIIEGNYNKQIRGDYIESVVQKTFANTGCPIKIFYCHASEETIFDRMKRRDAARDASKLSSPENWAKYLEGQPILPEELDAYDHVKVNTDEPIETIVMEIVDYLMLDDNQAKAAT